jgi:acyl dehydratase
MPLNQALVGKAYPAVSYEVGREKLREFAIAVGRSPRPAKVLDRAPEVGLHYSGVAHAEQEFLYHRPIRAGDRLLASGKVAAAAARGRHELLTLETEITTEAGEPVCTVRATLLSRGTAPPRGSAA